MNPIIGIVTKYRGKEHRSLRGRFVEIVAILKNAACTKAPLELLTDAEIEATGGVTTLDRVVVAVIAADRINDRIAGSVRAVDLDRFRAALKARGTA